MWQYNVAFWRNFSFFSNNIINGLSLKWSRENVWNIMYFNATLNRTDTSGISPTSCSYAPCAPCSLQVCSAAYWHSSETTRLRDACFKNCPGFQPVSFQGPFYSAFEPGPRTTLWRQHYFVVVGSDLSNSTAFTNRSQIFSVTFSILCRLLIGLLKLDVWQ